MKEIVAKELAQRVQNNQVIGVGTGSTVDLALKEIGARVKREKLNLRVVPTSIQSAWRCEQEGLAVLSPLFSGEIAWGFDGADAVDDELRLIKGKGGAMLQEKILAAKCKEYLIIVDDSKITKNLAAHCAIPVEVVPEASSIVKLGLQKLGAKAVTLREGSGKHGPVITEAGNIIFDAQFYTITPTLERDLRAIVGVVESGLFVGYATEVLVGSSAGVRVLKRS